MRILNGLRFLLLLAPTLTALGSDLPCASTVCPIDSLPTVGETDKQSCAATQYRLSPMPGFSYRAREASVAGVFYRIGTDDAGRVRYVTTSDTCFATPEAVGVGTTLSEIRRRFPKVQPQWEQEWVHFVTLPSGWSAVFAGSASRELKADAKVKWFFRR
jgi:hypothetical protein